MSNNATVSELGRRITQEENQLERLKEEVSKLTQTRDALQAQIDKKTSDFGVYMAQADAEIKKSRSDVAAAREKLTAENVEFQKILQAHKGEKANLENQKRDLEIQKLRQSASVKNVQEFITAVKRAVNVLGV